MDGESVACDCTAQVQEAVANATWPWLWISVGIGLVGLVAVLLVGVMWLFDHMLYRAHKRRVTQVTNSVRADVTDLTNFMRADLNKKEH